DEVIGFDQAGGIIGQIEVVYDAARFGQRIGKCECAAYRIARRANAGARPRGQIADYRTLAAQCLTADESISAAGGDVVKRAAGEDDLRRVRQRTTSAELQSSRIDKGI